MLSMPGALLFLIDCIATSVSNLCGGSFSSSIQFLFVCVLSRGVSHSTGIVFRRS